MTQQKEIDDLKKVLGQTSKTENPMCEECDVEMYPFAHQGIEGYSCHCCGWSFDID